MLICLTLFEVTGITKKFNLLESFNAIR